MPLRECGHPVWIPGWPGRSASIPTPDRSLIIYFDPVAPGQSTDFAPEKSNWFDPDTEMDT